MITIQNLHKTFYPGTVNENKSIAGLSLDIQAGDFITVIGSNGAGKSTLMNLLAGSLTADSGSIVVDGRDVTAAPEHARAPAISRVFQDPMKGSAGSLTIAENMALAMKRGAGRGLRRGVQLADRDRFRHELAKLRLGLEDRLDDTIGLLSGGQRQSITLLMAALVRPSILLLDEHTAALDPKTAKTVMALTKQMIEEFGLTALMITHNMEHALAYGNRLVMLHKGRVAFDLQGEERQRETEQGLLSRFYAISHDDDAEDSPS